MKARCYLLLVCIFWYSLSAFSQLCSNSALVPVFKQDFGQGASSSSKTTVPAGFSTNYDFQDDDPLSDGEYIVTPRVQNSQRNDWAQGLDHTGNTNGNMFLVNAGTGAALFFTQQVNNLCPGSTYTFSAWLANVNTTSHTLPICDDDMVYPNVTFRIKNTSGTILGTYSTGALPLTANRLVQPNWLQYGFSFVLPAGTTSLVLEMVDAYGGQPQCGNDLAIDDILFTACTPTATAAFSTGPTVCTGTNSSMGVTLTNSPFTTPAYQWQKSTDGGSNWTNIGTAGTSATSYPLNNISMIDAAVYRVLVGPDVASLSSNTCITASNSITLTVNPSPALTVGSNSPVCSGNNINLTSVVTSGTATFTYAWSGPGGFSSATANPVINNSAVAHSGTYSVVVTDSKTCTASGNTSVTVNTTPTVGSITGNNGGCAGATISLTNATTGGTWSSSNNAVATVDVNGVVSLVSAGSVTITYTVSNAGCTASATKNITVNSVSMHPDVIECNNGITHFDASNAVYGVTYSNSNPGNTYLWSITGGTVSYQGSSSSTSQYPDVQLQTGAAYTATVQFTSGGITCSATQMVYKNITAAETISGPDNVTICFTTASLALSATTSPVTNNHSWTTSGTGVFSNPSSLNTTYTPSAADRAAGVVTITLTGSSTLNMNGNCGSATATDAMTLNILPQNTGTNTTSTICSNQLFSHTASSSIGGSSFTWVSTVMSGTGSGNATNGSGNIANTLTNNSTTTDFVVQYTVTPTNNGCSGTPYTVTVTVKPLPSLTINNASPSNCTGVATNIQLSDVLTGTQYSWSSTVINGTASGNSNQASPTTTSTISDALINTSSSAAVVRYVITAHSLSGCTSTGTTDVTVYPQPTTSQTGNDQSLCNVSSATLNGNTPASGTGTWTMVSGPNTPVFTNASSPSSTVTGLTTGTYVFRWSISNGICAASQDDVTVLVSPVTQAGTLSADATVCAPTNNGALAVTGYTGTIINWQSSDDNGATWTTLSNNTPNHNFNNLTTTTLFKAAVQSGSCSILFSNTVTITALQPPTTSNAGPDQQRNGITSATLAGNDPVNGTGAWTQVSGPNTATFSDAASYNSSVTNLIIGTYVFRWTITNGICGNSVDEMQLIVDPPTVTGTLSADATVCATGGNGATLTLTGYLGNILRWQSSVDNGNNWIDITNTTDNHTYSNLTNTTLFRAEVQNGTDAPAFTSHVTITVLQPVTTANAGSDQTLCDLTSATLAANNPSSGTGTWSLVSGPPSATSFSNLNGFNSAINGLVAGTYQLKWTIANGGVCPPSEDLVGITIVPPTNPGNVAADATVCATANSGTLSITGFTGDIVHGEYSVNNGLNWNVLANSNNTTTIPYTNLPVTTQFRALVKNSVCPAVYSNIVTITVLQAVTVANAGSDQELCATNSATLAANNPSSGTGNWTQVSGPNTAGFVNAGGYNTNATGLIAGTYVFRWTISNGSCASSQDDVTIVVHPATVPGTVTGTALVCYGNNSGVLNLNGYTGSIVRWEYSIDGGGAWANIANNTNTHSYSNLTTTTLFRASVQSGICLEQFTNNVLVTINPLTVAGTLSSDATVCASSNNGTLTLNGYTGSILQWESSADNGNTWSVISNTNNQFTYSNLTVTTIYRALVQNGICASQYSSQVTITVSPTTVPGTLSSDATVCASANNGTLVLAGNTGSILRWESSTDNGNSWVTIANTTTSLVYTNLTVSTIYRVLVQSGVCASQYSNSITITVNPVTIAGTLSSNATVCVSGNNGTLSLNGFTGTILQWESSVDNGNTWMVISNTTNAFSYSNLTVTTLYRVLVQSGICASQYSNNVVITVSPVTIPGTLSASATVCALANTGTLTLAGYTGSILQWESSADNGNSWTVISNTTNSFTYNNLATTTVYRVLLQSGGCGLQYSNQATITVNPVTVPGILSANAMVCASSNNGTLQLTGYTGNILQWESSIDNGNTWTVIANTTSNFSYTNLTTTTVYRALVQSGICASQYSNHAVITVSPITIAGTLSADATVCASSNNGTLSLTGNTGNVLHWERSTDNGNTWTLIANTTNALTYNNLTATTMYRALVESGLCASQYSNNVTITVNPGTVAGILSANATVCAASNNGTLSLAGYTGNILQWESSIDNGNTWSIISNTTNSFTYTNLIATTVYRALVQSGVCASQYSNNVTITVSPVTVAGTLSANTTVCASSNNGTLSLSGYTGSIIQWESSIDNGSTWTIISNSANSFTYNNLTTTTVYRVLVQSGACASAYSNNVSITVNPGTAAGTLSANATVCAASNTGTLSLVDYTGNILQWERSTDNGNSWSIISNTTNSFTYNNLAATTVYRALVQSGVCASQYSNNVTITVSPVTVAGTLSANTTVCATSNNGTLGLSGYTGSIIQWESSIDNGSTWSIISNTTSSFIYNNLGTTTTYRVLVQSGVCASGYSNNVTITVNPATVAGTLSANATVCAASNNGTLSLAGYTGSTLQWEISTDNANTWAIISNTTSSFTYNNLIATSLYRVLVQSGVCGPQYSNIAVITVAQPVTRANSGADQVLCNTPTASLQANIPLSGTGGWSLLSGPSAAGIGDALSPNTTVSGLTAGTYQFKWTISNNVCPASADTVSIQVLPVLGNTIDTITKTLCTGQSVTIAGIPASGGNGVYVYKWESSADGIQWSVIPGATTASYSFTPAANVFLRRTVTSHTCSLVSGVAAVVVQPSLAGNTITGDQDICLGTKIAPLKGTTATGGDGNYRYQWEQRPDNSSNGTGTDWSAISNANNKDLPDIVINRTTSFRRIVTTALCYGPQSLPSNVITVKIKPIPELSLNYKGGAYCSKDTVIEFITQTQNVDSIRWDFGDGTVEMAGAGKVAHRYTRAGTFIPKILASNSGNCVLSITPQDTIRIEDIRPGFTLSGVFDCGKTTYQFNDTSQSYFAIASRTWLVNNIPVNGDKEYRHTFNNVGDNETRLLLRSINGCEKTLDAKFNVAVFQYPKADINAVAQACQNNLVELQSRESTVDSVIIRSWNLGNGLQSSDSIVKVSYRSSGAYTVKLTVATVNKCYDSAFRILSIHPTPKLSVSSPQVICKGDSAIIKVSGAANYIWKDQDNKIVCSNCPSLRVLPQKNMQYNVIAYSEYGCSEIGGTSVRVIPPLTLNAKLADTICVGESRRLIVSGADNYTWLPAAGLSSYSVANPSASPVVTTTYTVIGKDAFNCFADTATIRMEVGNPTKVAVGKDTVVLAGSSIQLRVVGALPNIKKWKWDGGDFSCINCPTPTVRVTNDACVSCTATNIYGCISSDTLCIKTFCPTTEVFIPNAFTPDGDGINDRVYVQGKGIRVIKSFRIFSRWGEMLFEKTNFLPGDPSYGWDGKIKGKTATPDVFVYVCEVICEKGTPNIYKGNVAIIK